MVCIALRFALATVAVYAAPQNGFLRNGGGTSRTISSSELEVTLRESLEGLMGSGTAARRAAEIESRMWRTFQALPKNANGRLAPKTVRYIVHNYFAKEHGWLIEGLEPQGMRANASDVHEASIIQTKAPAILEALLEHRQSDQGLNLQDTVAMVAALEHLIFDESIVLLERAYALNGMSTGDALDEIDLHEVLRSYLLLFRQGNTANLFDEDLHRSIKARYSTKAGWHDIVGYEQDVQHDYDFNVRNRINPFVQRRYSFEEASQMVINMAEGYGKWQNADCKDMKEHLMTLDKKNTGRIPLDTFYRSDAGSAYEFTESLEYLRDVGALDESLKSNPGVLIANYLAGPSNCIASNSYYSVCCLNECETIMNEIEGITQAPTAGAKKLLGILSNVSTSTIDAPRELSRDMRTKLDLIANQNDGAIPIHGRLFAQWLHFAFPHECPMPTTSEAALTPSAWLNGAAIGSEEERDRHIQNVEQGDLTHHEHTNLQWSEEEILPFSEPRRAERGMLSGLFRFGMQISAILFVLKAAYSTLQTTVCAHQGTEWKDKKGALPI